MARTVAGPDDDRPVLVAVSPTTGSPDAVAWAVDEAHRRGVALRAISAWRPSRTGTSAAGRPPASAPPDPVEAQRGADSLLAAALRQQLGAAASDVDRRAVPGRPSSVLRVESADGQLLVLGAPRSRTARAALVAITLVHRADCPVVTMPRRTGRRRGLIGR